MQTFITLATSIILSHLTMAQDVKEIFLEEFDTFFIRRSLQIKYDILELRDTLPSNFPDGHYIFYNIPRKDSSEKRFAKQLSGTYLNGVKNGEFICEEFQYNKKIKKYEVSWQQLITYRGGMKNGCHKEYYMSYQYHKKELFNEVSTMTVYIEYTDNVYDGFYMVLNDFSAPDDRYRGELTLGYYQKGKLIQTMKCNGLALPSVYHNLHGK